MGCCSSEPEKENMTENSIKEASELLQKNFEMNLTISGGISSGAVRAALFCYSRRNKKYSAEAEGGITSVMDNTGTISIRDIDSKQVLIEFKQERTHCWNSVCFDTFYLDIPKDPEYDNDYNFGSSEENERDENEQKMNKNTLILAATGPDHSVTFYDLDELLLRSDDRYQSRREELNKKYNFESKSNKKKKQKAELRKLGQLGGVHTSHVTGGAKHPLLQQFVSCSAYDGVLAIWNVSSLSAATVRVKKDKLVSEASLCCNYNPSGSLIVASCMSGLVVILESESGAVLRKYKVSEPVYHACWSNSGRIFCFASGNQCYFFDEQKEARRTAKTATAQIAEAEVPTLEVKHKRSTAVLEEEGEEEAEGESGNKSNIWKVVELGGEGSPSKKIRERAITPYWVAFTRDDTKAFFCGSVSHGAVVDVESLQVESLLEIPDGIEPRTAALFVVSFSKYGRSFLVGGFGGLVTLWNSPWISNAFEKRKIVFLLRQEEERSGKSKMHEAMQCWSVLAITAMFIPIHCSPSWLS